MSDEYEVIKRGIKDESEAPRDKDIFYRCLECGGVVPSDPKGELVVECSCGNIHIDMAYFRLVVRDCSKFEAVRKLG